LRLVDPADCQQSVSKQQKTTLCTYRVKKDRSLSEKDTTCVSYITLWRLSECSVQCNRTVHFR